MKARKVLEIIEPQINQKRQYSGRFYNPEKSNKNVTGSGHFSSVAPSKNDPHTIKKYSKAFYGDAMKDAFHTYANYVYIHKLWENPYFPKIYKKDTIEDKEGKQVNKYEIEKLTELHDLSKKELIAVMGRIFGFNEDEALEFIKDQLANNKEKLKKLSANKLIANLIAALLKSAVLHGKYVNKMEDKNLVNAIKHLKRLTKILIPDFSGDNLMVRRSPYGAQLVFADPFMTVKPKEMRN